MKKIFNLIKKKKLQEIYEIDNFLSSESCNLMLDILNDLEFKGARQFDKGRHNKELFSDDKLIYELLKSQVTSLELIGIEVNEISFPSEFYKYDKEDFITAHSDAFVKFNSGISNYTAVIYLNDDFLGGETYFNLKSYGVSPKMGKLLLFQHSLVHEAKKLEIGTKIIYRSNWKISAK